MGMTRRGSWGFRALAYLVLMAFVCVNLTGCSVMGFITGLIQGLAKMFGGGQSREPAPVTKGGPVVLPGLPKGGPTPAPPTPPKPNTSPNIKPPPNPKNQIPGVNSELPPGQTH